METVSEPILPSSMYSNHEIRLLLWLDKKQPNCVSEAAKKELSETYNSLPGANDKQRNKAVNKKAVVIICLWRSL